MRLRRDLWRVRRDLGRDQRLASILVLLARTFHQVVEPVEIGDGFGNVASVRAWVGLPGDLHYVQLPARCWQGLATPGDEDF